MKKLFLLILSLILISLIAYQWDKSKMNKDPFVDLYGTFQESDFPKDLITFYSENAAYEYTFQDKYYSETGTYELTEDIVYFRTGPLRGQQATVKESRLVFDETSVNKTFEKISQTPVLIEYDHE